MNAVKDSERGVLSQLSLWEGAIKNVSIASKTSLITGFVFISHNKHGSHYQATEVGEQRDS